MGKKNEDNDEAPISKHQAPKNGSRVRSPHRQSSRSRTFPEAKNPNVCAAPDRVNDSYQKSTWRVCQFWLA